jgi:nitrogen fixation NifU-like protein
MFDDLRDLYQELILEHGRKPRNRRELKAHNREALGRNPVCGDALVIYLDVGPDGRVEDAAFRGQGCAISMASASLMTEIVRGKTEDEARRLIAALRALATGEGEAALDGLEEEDVERLQALAGVRRFPVRVKCATLPWHTLEAAIAGAAEATTE